LGSAWPGRDVLIGAAADEARGDDLHVRLFESGFLDLAVCADPDLAEERLVEQSLPEVTCR
jgi:hypothetical protein